ncbi:hypothetical protein AVEN_193473-1 [Araneus ventricosus]|uniref:Uncharacterized protein n=1 Tax=Araneus ventricosus TaxID=182803 RepID=A0A4Y2V960_ARAVE|nr:hypothetical protein AVEN_193473-1 [Araneus ventricosus]
MESRKWTPNSDALRQLWKREGLENQPQDNPISPRVNSTKILGMLWNTVEDHLTVGMQSLVDSLSNNENTKLHPPSSVDEGNVLGRRTAPDIQKTWCQWISEVPRLSELQIPRYVLCSSAGEPTDVLELHCDASRKACGVFIYTRVVKDCNVEVNLLVSKSRVAPLTKIVLPRLITRCIACRPTSKQSQSNSRSQKAF